ncbi:MAG TPA: DUF6338 family protein [Jatrophihabitans sp.]|nr:DUF6338 family protein [Jatrophihabitans sp.]
MPTTAVGLILFVVLLAPGLSYSAYRAVHGPVRKPSALRELGAIALRSAVSDVFALGVFGLVRIVLPSHTPDVGRLARNPASYLRADLAYLFWWAVAVLMLACGAAIGAARLPGRPSVRRLAGRAPFRWLPSRQGISPDPAWWFLFNQYPDKQAYAGAVLDDGSYLGGWLLTFSLDSDETADREITLTGPIAYRSPTAAKAVDLGVGAVAVSARRIQYLTVSYLEPELSAD